jgi:hypothetical protein
MASGVKSAAAFISSKKLGWERKARTTLVNVASGVPPSP